MDNNNSAISIPPKASLLEICNQLKKEAGGKTVWIGRTIQSYQGKRRNYAILAIVSLVVCSLLVGLYLTKATPNNLSYFQFGIISSGSAFALSSSALIYYHRYLTKKRDCAELRQWIEIEAKKAADFIKKNEKASTSNKEGFSKLSDYKNRLENSIKNQD